MAEEQSERIEKLLDEFEEQRFSLKEMVKEIENLKVQVDNIFPSSNARDYRNFRLFEEKLRAATEFYKAILDIKKEIGRSLKDEAELRKKLLSSSDDDIESNLDISDLAEKVEKHEKKAKNIRHKIEERHQ